MSEPDIADLIGTAIRPPSELKAICGPPDEDTTEDSSVVGAQHLTVSCWAVTGDHYSGVGKTTPTLPAGCYEPHVGENGPFLSKLAVVTDNLLILPDDAARYILDDFSQFWEMKARFNERGFLHKRGILLWGPPGSGKTSTIQLLIKRVIEDLNGIVLMVDRPNRTVLNLQIIRKIEPDRPVICIMEDIDTLVTDYGESGFLNMLDGEAQVDNIVFLATTNYPERLDGRFVDRPSRFDIVKYIGMPSAAARKFYLKAKEPTMSEEELDMWTATSDGLSIPHLKEMIISVKCYGRSLDETLERLKKMHKKKFKSDDSSSLGFR